MSDMISSEWIGVQLHDTVVLSMEIKDHNLVGTLEDIHSRNYASSDFCVWA